jgi:hypothetical protein
MIVDDVDRREIDVCAGAVGWLGKENGIEILYLYDEAVQISAINFIPMATNDTIYYVDSFDKNRFLKTDYIFGKAYEERMAELKHIAFSLGAKSCSVEISESNIETEIHRKEYKGKQAINGLPAVNESISVDSDQSRSGKRKETRMGRVYARFHGSDIPKKPELKWFRNDENIKRLIEMRFESGNSIKSEQFELSGSSSATMSQKTAAAIDIAIKKAKIKGNFKAGTTVSAQVIRECNSKLLYSIEF